MKKPKLFSFWKENKKAGLFQLSVEQLIKEFEAWLPKKNKLWIEHYGTRDIVSVFVGEKEGLNSVGNDENDYAEYEEMAEILKPVKNKYLDGLTK